MKGFSLWACRALQFQLKVWHKRTKTKIVTTRQVACWYVPSVFDTCILGIVPFLLFFTAIPYNLPPNAWIQHVQVCCKNEKYMWFSINTWGPPHILQIFHFGALPEMVISQLTNGHFGLIFELPVYSYPRRLISRILLDFRFVFLLTGAVLGDPLPRLVYARRSFVFSNHICSMKLDGLDSVSTTPWIMFLLTGAVLCGTSAHLVRGRFAS